MVSLSDIFNPDKSEGLNTIFLGLKARPCLFIAKRKRGALEPIIYNALPWELTVGQVFRCRVTGDIYTYIGSGRLLPDELKNKDDFVIDELPSSLVPQETIANNEEMLLLLYKSGVFDLINLFEPVNTLFKTIDFVFLARVLADRSTDLVIRNYESRDSYLDYFYFDVVYGRDVFIRVYLEEDQLTDELTNQLVKDRRVLLIGSYSVSKKETKQEDGTTISRTYRRFYPSNILWFEDIENMFKR